MNIDPSELAQNGYIELDRLGHKELVPFIRTYMKKRTKSSVTYYLANLVTFAFAGYLFTHDINSPSYSIGDKFTYFCYGLAIVIALVPLHEYIHVLAYRSQGAKKTSYDVNLKKSTSWHLLITLSRTKKSFEQWLFRPLFL